MRTIIINTLEGEFHREPLFYLPFREDEFHWLEHPLEGIHSCVQQICAYSEAQSKHQDYHLVVLVSLAHFSLAQYAQLRKGYEDILFAYLNQQLLHPLVQDHRQPVKGVSVVRNSRTGRHDFGISTH